MTEASKIPTEIHNKFTENIIEHLSGQHYDNVKKQHEQSMAASAHGNLIDASQLLRRRLSEKKDSVLD